MSKVPEPVNLTISMVRMDKLLAYVVSDVHLNDSHTIGSRRDNFVRFLRSLNSEKVSSQKTILVLNGDILDVTGSWHSDCFPWDPDSIQVESTLLCVLNNILDTHGDMVSELKQFLKNSGEIVYVLGNHDRLIGLYPAAQAMICKRLGLSNAQLDQLQFTSSYESVELGLYVEHGQRFDPFNQDNYQQRPPVGDVINILIVNRFVNETIDKLLEAGYSLDLVDEIEGILQQVEYLRPLALGPYWLASVSGQYCKHPENLGKPISIDQIINQVIRKTLLDTRLITLFAQRFHIPAMLLKLCFQALLAFPFLLPALSFLVSRLLYRTRSNDFQYRMAEQIHQKNGYHLVSFGHTHLPSLLPITEQDYYFNTGCWKPIIYLFRHPGHLLLEKTPFNKIERSGIFRVEKRLNQASAPVIFSLETLQNGTFGTTIEDACPVEAS